MTNINRRQFFKRIGQSAGVATAVVVAPKPAPIALSPSPAEVVDAAIPMGGNTLITPEQMAKEALSAFTDDTMSFKEFVAHKLGERERGQGRQV